MSKVAVSGLPPNITCRTISMCFSKILTRVGVRRFWVRELSYENGGKQAGIEFSSQYEASQAKSRLNNLLFHFNGHKYPLTAYVEGKYRTQSLTTYRRQYPSLFSDNYGPFDGQLYYDDERSQIRNLKEASEIDMEIELLRRQRLAVEEERRLIVEARKLELVKEYGTSAVKELAYIDQLGQKAVHMHRGSRRLEKRPYRPLPRPPLYMTKVHFTPLFILPCKLLIKSMIDKLPFGTNEDEVKILLRRIRVTLRKRIAVALEGKPRMTTQDIIKLYRKLYPETTDDNLVQRYLKMLREEPNKEEMETPVEAELSEPSTSTTEATPEPITKAELSEPSLACDEEVNNESALSLDATEIESLNHGERDWDERHDWWNDDANQGFVE